MDLLAEDVGAREGDVFRRGVGDFDEIAPEIVDRYHRSFAAQDGAFDDRTQFAKVPQPCIRFEREHRFGAERIDVFADGKGLFLAEEFGDGVEVILGAEWVEDDDFGIGSVGNLLYSIG